MGRKAVARGAAHLAQQPAPGACEGQVAGPAALLSKRRVQHHLVHLQMCHPLQMWVALDRTCLKVDLSVGKPDSLHFQTQARAGSLEACQSYMQDAKLQAGPFCKVKPLHTCHVVTFMGTEGFLFRPIGRGAAVERCCSIAHSLTCPTLRCQTKALGQETTDCCTLYELLPGDMQLASCSCC